mgnify:CR=1 FL=1
MAGEELTSSTENAPAGEVTSVSDEGVSDAGGGPMDWSWLFEGIDGAIDGWYQRESEKKSLRGYDPCHYFASIEELWYNNIGPIWWKAQGTARKTAMALERAINESITNQGKAKPAKYATSTKLQKFVRQQLSDNDLVPPFAFAVALLAGPFAPAVITDLIKARLPSGSAILAGQVNRQERGFEVSPGVYVWGPGLPDEPSTDAEKSSCWQSGKYGGPGFAQVVDAWTAQQVARVVPAGYLSARAKLERIVGTWQGTGPWGIWQPADGFLDGSRIGFLDEFRTRMWREYEEAQVLCEELRQHDRAIDWGEQDLERDKALIDASRWWGLAAALLVGAALIGKKK